jgi:hypothetical protein
LAAEVPINRSVKKYESSQIQMPQKVGRYDSLRGSSNLQYEAEHSDENQNQMARVGSPDYVLLQQNIENGEIMSQNK